MPLDITIPTTTTSQTSPPYTVYTLHLRSPLRTTILHKRYTDFSNLHASLTSQAGTAPPATLPAKSWFRRTVNSPELTESRRTGLESYLKTIEGTSDPCWRNTRAWQDFLGQAADWTGTDAERAKRTGVKKGPGGATGDVEIKSAAHWLDVHRELKSTLHTVRQALTRRERATVASAQHGAAADAKAALIKSGSLIKALRTSLKSLSGHEEGWGREKLGEGEIRRRRDMVGAAEHEKEGLEEVLNSLAVKAAGIGEGESAAATEGDKQGLFRGSAGASSAGRGGVGRRVLGAPAPETERTRELGNEGVLQLQKQIMQEQDEDVTDLTRVVRRMREMGVQINEEIVLQNEMMGLLDQDVDRVAGKIDVAKKRIGQIS